MGSALVPNCRVMYVRTVSLFLLVVCCAGCGRSRLRPDAPSGKPVVVGKLLIQSPGVRTSDDSEKFLGDQIKILQGPKLREKADEMLVKDHPDWVPSDIKLEIGHVRGSATVSLVGHGGATDCARALIDLMMDIYLTTVVPSTKSVANFKDESVRLEKNLLEAERAWNGFKLDHDMAHADSNQTSLKRRLKQFSNAREFYQREIESSTSLSLEQDIERRKASHSLPPDMPTEFAILARITPSPSELAYLIANKQTNAVATEAARKEAAQEKEARLDSHRRQLGLITELLGGIESDIQKLNALKLEALKIEQTYMSVESAYKMAKEAEKNDDLSAYNTIAPPVRASIIERAAASGGEN